MTVRTCQLCGKSLSRLRNVEGDFCSKEHKSQYRLRAGMNRLQEANKVANLMRRRENPRQIVAARLICNSDGAARLCEPPKLLSTRTEPAAAWPAFAVSGQSRMPETPQGYQNPAPAGMQGAAAPRRPNTSRIRIGVNKQALALPKRGHSMPARLVQARMSQLRAASLEAKARHRPYERLPHSKIRVDVGGGPTALRRGDALGKVVLHPAARTHLVRTAPRQGKALRVSTAIGFRVPSAHLRRHISKPLMRNALVWPGKPYSTTPDRVARPADPKLLQVVIPMAATRCPGGPGPARATRFIRANTVTVPSSKPVRGTKPPTRFSGVNWNPADPRWAGKVPGPESAGFTRRNGAHLFALPMQAFTMDTLRQFASAPIQVREGPVGYPKVVIQDTLAGAILSPTSLPPVSASLAEDENQLDNVVEIASVQKKFEENFDAGWDNWSGGTADWKVDIAGVRTGSLALFTQSMDMIDYDLEFLTRIDHHTVNWVIRAANPNEYCQCTLTALPGGELELSHSFVFDGAAEPAVTAAGRIAAKPKSALTVRTHVQGQTFTISVNGAPMDTWTDTRLPIGGVGFFGTPEDRARLYWIRLSSIGSPGKEYRKK
jgi:hypothetical protein